MNLVLKAEIINTFDEFIETLSSFANDKMNHIPFAESWTAGQVAEHIIKSVSKLPKMLYENTETTVGQFDPKVTSIRAMFLDYDSKMTSPISIIPSGKSLVKVELLNSIVSLKSQMVEAADTLDLTMTCKSFEFPRFGFLTRLE